MILRKQQFITKILLLFFCGIFQFTFAQSSLFSYEKYISTKGDTLKYRQLYPDYDTLQKYPLVIFLHGSGERGSDNEVQLKWGVQNFATDYNMKMHPAFVIAPQCPDNQDWSEFRSKKDGSSISMEPMPTKPMQLLIELIKQFKKNNSIDTNRIYITGLSMGGFGTFDIIQRYPNLFAAAVPVCGGGDVTKAATIKHIPMWIFHGAEDQVVSPNLSVNMLQALMKAGAHPGYTQYPTVGHFSWIAAYSDAMMMEWLFKQHK
jgi:predicted peptidase